ncbi:MAG: hypothetical protein U9N59_06245 [Campylobacterota bacterium]|nr:hypothetical protein [Campylobacterota bacterium]
MRPINRGEAHKNKVFKHYSDARDDLKLEWNNFLLACKTCNTIKNDKDIDECIFPDTDNTAYAYKYTQTKVTTNPNMTKEEQILSQNSLDLIDINRQKNTKNRDDDRVIRSQEWNKAILSLQRYLKRPDKLMAEQIGVSPDGFISSWLEIFKDYPEVKEEIIKNTKGTALECYDERFDPIKKLER